MPASLPASAHASDFAAIASGFDGSWTPASAGLPASPIAMLKLVLIVLLVMMIPASNRRHVDELIIIMVPLMIGAGYAGAVVAGPGC